MLELGQRLVELRKKHNITQTEIAERLNVSQQVVSNIERGVTPPKIEQLKIFADLYNVSIDYLIGHDYREDKIDDVEHRIMKCVKQMDEEGKELSLGILNQVAQYRGNNDVKK
jgi:transcriptional regulator with XRE-family HTH domain